MIMVFNLNKFLATPINHAGDDTMRKKGQFLICTAGQKKQLRSIITI